jgi:hypothetical protein
VTAVAWGEVERAAPELAAAGERLFRSFTLGYLATVGEGGLPRIAPVTITLYERGLYAFIRARTPKARDLAHDPRFALHAFPHFPSPTSFDDEEFSLRGSAQQVDNADLRSAVQALHNDAVEDRAHLYQLDVDETLHKQRVDGRSVYSRWRCEA